MLQDKKHKREFEVETPVRRRSSARLASSEDMDVASPARELQTKLYGDWDGKRLDSGRRWSPRATLALSGGIALLLWGAIGLTIVAIL
jgi:hypothetical protein